MKDGSMNGPTSSFSSAAKFLILAPVKLSNLTGKRTSKLIAWGIAKNRGHAYTPALT